MGKVQMIPRIVLLLFFFCSGIMLILSLVLYIIETETEVHTMAQMLSVKEIAALWGIQESLVTRYCRSGRIPGAVRDGHAWLIPADAKRPADRRRAITTSSLIDTDQKLPLPIGVSSYRLASKEYYYIDKTLLIKEFLDERPIVSLFTRPRRFGKTLNMDMLRTFFEKTPDSTAHYFVDKKIWACADRYRQHQGKYPVIYLSFKDAKRSTWEETYDYIKDLIRAEFLRHNELMGSSSISFKSYYQRIVENTASENDYTMSLAYLSQMLDEHHGIAPIIIIDEYDTPIQQGHTQDFYDRIVLFMRNLFSGGLKDNAHLSYGFLAGILRVAEESIFSGLNNLKVNSILDHKYSQYFGFTHEEVREMAAYYGVPEKYDEICAWYDGYRFGRTDIFNPWSVINYFGHECVPAPYWVSTSSNDIIEDILKQADTEIYECLNALLQGESITALIDTSVIYPQIEKNPSSIYSFLLVAGYLKVINTMPSFHGDLLCEVALPNQEISFVYKKEVLKALGDIVPQSVVAAIQKSLCTGNPEALKQNLRKLLLESVSSYDTAGKNFYHGLVLGLCAIMEHQYFISSNRESGEGRYDIQLMPKSAAFPGILIELKAGKGCTDDALKELSQTALRQIHDRKYDTEMRAKGVSSIYQYGVAFCGKKVEITAD